MEDFNAILAHLSEDERASLQDHKHLAPQVGGDAANPFMLQETVAPPIDNGANMFDNQESGLPALGFPQHEGMQQAPGGVHTAFFAHPAPEMQQANPGVLGADLVQVEALQPVGGVDPAVAANPRPQDGLGVPWYQLEQAPNGQRYTPRNPQGPQKRNRPPREPTPPRAQAPPPREKSKRPGPKAGGPQRIRHHKQRCVDPAAGCLPDCELLNGDPDTHTRYRYMRNKKLEEELQHLAPEYRVKLWEHIPPQP